MVWRSIGAMKSKYRKGYAEERRMVLGKRQARKTKQLTIAAVTWVAVRFDCDWVWVVILVTMSPVNIAVEISREKRRTCHQYPVVEARSLLLSGTLARR